MQTTFRATSSASKIVKRIIFWSVIAFSVVSLFLTPLDTYADKVIAALPLIGIGLIATEAFFIAGLLIMAMSIGIKIKNPLTLRTQLKSVLRGATATRTFWAGFWVNAIGAVGSSIIVCIGIFFGLPVATWILIYIPLADIAATITIRYWALRAHRRNR